MDTAVYSYNKRINILHTRISNKMVKYSNICNIRIIAFVDITELVFTIIKYNL